MITIKEIMYFLKESNIMYTYSGDENLTIKSYAPLYKLGKYHISWIKDNSKLNIIVGKSLKDTLIISKELDISHFKDGNFIFCQDPKQVFFTILNHYFKVESKVPTIHSDSVVETSNIGKDVSIGHNCYIGPDVVIGDNVEIKNNVSIEGKVVINKNTLIHSGVILGTDGFGYFLNNKCKNEKVPHFGGIIIGENVEIGANTCIDRGTLDDTKIGNDVKINNLCHIGHNVIIEDNVMISALCNIAGSVLVKKNAYIAPAATILNQLTIGENSLVGSGAVVVKNVEKHVVVVGVPGKFIRKMEDDHL